MDTLLVILIVGLAGAYLVSRFYRSSKQGVGCGGGCSSCDIGTTCNETEKEKS
ncbi:MAG: FeoB-associated Cys-rich membrane protein [Deltaproteobacteria bacterium]|nr:FeoB-associated Cys-rich membrane protein [Deltaproteobacteria bacterium]